MMAESVFCGWICVFLCVDAVFDMSFVPFRDDTKGQRHTMLRSVSEL